MNDRNENPKKTLTLVNPSKKTFLDSLKNMNEITHLIIKNKKFSREELNTFGNMLAYDRTVLTHLVLIECTFDKPLFYQYVRSDYVALENGFSKNKSLTTLSLDGCSDLFKIICEMKIPNITHLTISNIMLRRFGFLEGFTDLAALCSFLVINKNSLKTLEGNHIEIIDSVSLLSLFPYLTAPTLSSISISTPPPGSFLTLSRGNLIGLLNNPSLKKLNIENLVLPSEEIDPFLSEFSTNVHCLDLGFLVCNFNCEQYQTAQKILARNLLLSALDANSDSSHMLSALDQNEFAKCIALIYDDLMNEKPLEYQDEILAILFYLQYEKENTIVKKFDRLMRSVAHLEKCQDNANATQMLKRIDALLSNKQPYFQIQSSLNEAFWSHLSEKSDKLSEVTKYTSTHAQQRQQLQTKLIAHILEFKMERAQENFAAIASASKQTSSQSNYGFFSQEENTLANILLKQLSQSDVDPNIILSLSLEANNLGQTGAEQQLLTALNKMIGDYFQALSEQFMPSKKLEIKPNMTPTMSIN